MASNRFIEFKSVLVRGGFLLLLFAAIALTYGSRSYASQWWRHHGGSQAPTITGSPPASVLVGSSYYFKPTTTDPSGKTLSFSISNRPRWASFSTTTGKLSGTPTAAGTSSGITISVSDGMNSASLPAFSIQVSAASGGGSPLTISGTPGTTIQTGQAYSFTPTTSGGAGSTRTFSITAKPSWATFSTSNGKLSGTPTAAGTFSGIVISVSDGTNTAALAAFSIQVTAAGGGTGLTISGSPLSSIQVGQAYSFVPSVSGNSGGTLTFSITNKPAWATFSTTTGQLSGTPTATGTFASITISVSNGSSSASLPAFTLTVIQSTGGSGAAALCDGLVTGKQKVPYTAVARPPKLTPITDPDFGTTIIRITDVAADWGGTTAVPVYPTVPTWNIDESYMLLYIRGASAGNYALFDGKTYAFLKWLPISPADVEQFDWDTSDPDILWYISGKVLTRYHVSTGAKDSVHTFAAAADWGDDPIYFSWDGQLFGLREQSAGTILSYRMGVGESPTMPGQGTSPEACPSGTCLIWSSSTSKVLDPSTLATVRTMTLPTIEHADLGLDSQGNDFWATVSFNEGPGGSSGALMVEWLKSGTVKTIIGDANGDPYPPTGILISAKSLKNPGWVTVAATGTPTLSSTYQDQEIMVANVETGQVCRAAHHRSRGESGPIGYWAQPNVTFSPRGTRIVFPSDWGSGSVVDTYVVVLPSYKP